MPSDDYKLAEFRDDMRDLRTKVDAVAVSVAGMAARHEAQSSDVSHMHGRMNELDARLRLAEKHEENARRIVGIESELLLLRGQAGLFATKESVAQAFELITDLRITKARLAGLLAGAAAVGGLVGGIVQIAIMAIQN